MPHATRIRGILGLLLVSLLLTACSSGSSEKVLTLPTDSATTTAATTSSATTSAATTRAGVSATTATSATANTTDAATISAAQTSPTPRPSFKPPTGYPGKLVFLDADNLVYTSRFDGKNPQLVLGQPGSRVSETQDGILYDWPTWSQDGTKLAVMGYNFKGGNIDSSDVYVLDADGKNGYKLEAASQDRPIFMSWSPDSSLFSLLVSPGSSQLELRLFDMTKGAAASNPPLRKVAEGQSVYTNWSPDSKQLLIHASSGTSETISLLSAKDNQAKAVPFPVKASSFRSPAFSQDGSKLAYAIVNDKSGNEDIYLADKTGKTTAHIETGGRGASFVWSPGGNRLAHTYLIPGSQAGVSKGVALSETGAAPSADGKLAATQIINEPVVGFFWSPDGKKLAYVGFNETEDLLTWKIYDIDSKKTTLLTEWYPSHDMIQLLNYYDQYAQTNPLWSPDSKAITFAGFSKQDAAAISASGQKNADPYIYILPIDGTSQPTAIANGGLSSWAK